ncbi:MAG: lytic transglycosylase domain-containing protein [archaeon]
MMNRRQFLRVGGIYVLGSLIFPLGEVWASPRKTLVEKIIYAESKGDPGAYREDTKAMGLMQITPIVLEEWNSLSPSKQFKIEDLFNPYINVNVGTWYLYKRIKGHYLPHYKLKLHEENMLASWNIGPTKHGTEIGDARKNFHKLPSKAREFIKEVRSLA